MQRVFIWGAMLVALFFGLIYIYYTESELISIQYSGERAIVERVTNYDTKNSIGGSAYVGTFDFKTDDGQNIHKESAFPVELLDDIQANQPIVVCYRPNNPENFVFERSTPSMFLFLFVVFLFHIVAIAFKNALLGRKTQSLDDEVRIIATQLERK